MDEPTRLDTTGVWLTTSLCKAIRAADRRRLRAHFDTETALAHWLAQHLPDAAARQPWRGDDAAAQPRGSPGTRPPSSLLSAAQCQALNDPLLLDDARKARTWAAAQPHHHLIGLNDTRYPTGLREVCDPPWLLYVNGQAGELDGAHVAIVGSRRASQPALRFAYRLGGALAESGLGVVSGLAQGIDGAAHEGCLAAGGVTLAVAATAPNRIYPSAHRDLARRITAQGAVVGEFELGSPLRPGCFPRRNRLISGLCLGVVVVEAALPSGSLITARQALDQGREVMAVPGSVLNPQAHGCHALIKDGAALVESADDVLAVVAPVLHRQRPDWLGSAGARASLPRQGPAGIGAPGPEAPAEPRDAALLAALGFEPAGLEQLSRALTLPPGTIAGRLTRLEIDGWIRSTGDGRYVRC